MAEYTSCLSGVTTRHDCRHRNECDIGSEYPESTGRQSHRLEEYPHRPKAAHVLEM